MDRILKDFISLFFPRSCLGCKKILLSTESLICLHCRLSLPVSTAHLEKLNPLKSRLSSIRHLKQAYSFLYYNKGGIAQKLLKRLKYEDNEEIGEMLGLWMGNEIRKAINEIDIIIPVPLHDKKLIIRGYNQSDSISKGLSESLKVPWNGNLFIRAKHNATQTKKSKTDRWLNVELLFEANEARDIVGKHVLLVDDVITTGATIESMAEVVINAGAKSISVACIASGQ
jgi:ComF family protein